MDTLHPPGSKPEIPKPRTVVQPARSTPHVGPDAGRGPRGGDRKGKGPLLALAAAAVVVFGVVAFGGGGSSKARVEVSPVANANVLQAINGLQVPDSEKEQLKRRANADEIEFWRYTVLGSRGAASEVYTVSTDLASHSYTVAKQNQEFILWTTKGRASFVFNAVTDNQNPGMPGEWMTPKGTYPFEMQPGGALTIPVR